MPRNAAGSDTLIYDESTSPLEIRRDLGRARGTRLTPRLFEPGPCASRDTEPALRGTAGDEIASGIHLSSIADRGSIHDTARTYAHNPNT